MTISPAERIGQRFPRRRAVVTGAGAGLGLEICCRLSDAGWTVGMIDLDSDRVRAAADSLPRTRWYGADMRDPAAVNAAITAFAAAEGGIDLMINNAGVAVGGKFEDISASDWEWVLSINLMGVVNGTKAALPILRGQPGGGCLHNVASAAGFMSAPMMSAYNASKAAVVAFTETLAGELEGIEVSVSLPAFFRTKLLDALRAPPSEMEIARLLTDNSGYTVAAAADDILSGIADRQFYVFAPRRLRRLWWWKRFAPANYLRNFPKARMRRIEMLKRKAAV